MWLRFHDVLFYKRAPGITLYFRIYNKGSSDDISANGGLLMDHTRSKFNSTRS